jgi:hypothetical protein
MFFKIIILFFQDNPQVDGFYTSTHTIIQSSSGTEFSCSPNSRVSSSPVRKKKKNSYCSIAIPDDIDMATKNASLINTSDISLINVSLMPQKYAPSNVPLCKTFQSLADSDLAPSSEEEKGNTKINQNNRFSVILEEKPLKSEDGISIAYSSEFLPSEISVKSTSGLTAKLLKKAT